MPRVYSLEELEQSADESAMTRVRGRGGSGDPATVWGRLFSEHPEGGGPFGGRNPAMCRLAGALRRKNLPYDAALAIIRLWNQGYCIPPLPDAEVEERLNYWWANWPEGPEEDLTREEALEIGSRRK